MGAHNRIYRLSAEDRTALDEQLRDPGKSYSSVRAWLASRGHHFGVDSICRYAWTTGLRKGKPRQFLRIDRILMPEQRKQYLALVVDPRSSVSSLQAWLLARGHGVSKTTITLHRDRYLEDYGLLERGAREAEMVVEIARESGITGLSEVALVRLEQFLMQQFTKRHLADEKVDARDLTEMSKSLATVMSTRETAEAIRRENEAQKRNAAEEAERLAKRGATGADIAARVKEILGA
jgi:hypothetical protein